MHFPIVAASLRFGNLTDMKCAMNRSLLRLMEQTTPAPASTLQRDANTPSPSS